MYLCDLVLVGVLSQSLSILLMVCTSNHFSSCKIIRCVLIFISDVSYLILIFLCIRLADQFCLWEFTYSKAPKEVDVGPFAPGVSSHSATSLPAGVSLTFLIALI